MGTEHIIQKQGGIGLYGKTVAYVQILVAPVTTAESFADVILILRFRNFGGEVHVELHHVHAQIGPHVVPYHLVPLETDNIGLIFLADRAILDVKRGGIEVVLAGGRIGIEQRKTAATIGLQRQFQEGVRADFIVGCGRLRVVGESGHFGNPFQVAGAHGKPEPLLEQTAAQRERCLIIVFAAVLLPCQRRIRRIVGTQVLLVVKIE